LEPAGDQNPSGEILKLSTPSKQFVIDTYAWVEYLIGSTKGALAKKYIESGSGFTPSIVVVELRKWYLKEIEAGRRSDEEMKKHFDFIQSITELLPLDFTLALKAGEISFTMKKRKKDWPIADSVVLASARDRSANVVSGDPHFKNLEEVIFIGEK
jgi:predicted nucleic acid-binding protein